MTPRIRVLIVDDTSHVREMLTTMLGVDGFEVSEAPDGPAAVAMVQEANPDVVVVDYMMPAVDGLETARRLRALRPRQIIIMYSAFIDAELANAAADAGVTLCLGKVDGLTVLEDEIIRLVGQTS